MIAVGAGVAAVLTLVASLLGVTIPARTGAFRVWVAPDGIGVAAMMAGVAFLLWKLAALPAAAPAWLRRAGLARGLALGLATLAAAGGASYGIKRYLWHGNELYWAIETDRASVVRSWLARVDDRAGVATELLGRAIAADAPEVSEVLLDAGAVTFPFPPGLADDPGASESALLSVCGWGGPKVLRLLLERGADPNSRGIGGRTPLHALLSREGLDRERLRTDATELAPMLDLLLSHGADPTLRPEPEKSYSLSPIEEAVHGGLDAVAERMRRGVTAAEARRDLRGVAP